MTSSETRPHDAAAAQFEALYLPDLAAIEAAERQALADPNGFYGAMSRAFDWAMPPQKIVTGTLSEGAPPRWFEGGQVNISVNCLDRHLSARADQPALVTEPNDPNHPPVTITYGELHERVEAFSAGLQAAGIGPGDRVCLYMPMIPELVVAMLAVARVGAVHTVVFAGFSARALADRIADAGARLVVTADSSARGARRLPLKPIVDEALSLLDEASLPAEVVLVHSQPDSPPPMTPGRDISLDDFLARGADHTPVAPYPTLATDPLFILYTSGSTGKPKGICHASGGYMVWAAYSFVNVFAARPGTIHGCTADIGWITGHTYLVYGPLLAGATCVLIEGVPTWPDARRPWQIITRHQIQTFYTAPTALRQLIAEAEDGPDAYPMPSLEVLGTVGEPINEAAWRWYCDRVGRGRCPVVDTWWQTETGGVMISALAGRRSSAPAHAGHALPGVSAVLLTPSGELIEPDPATTAPQEGLLCLSAPWPGMLSTIWGDQDRCHQTYLAPFPGYYFSGDGALRLPDGQFRIIGRVDDVLNVSGHRLGTAELESAAIASDEIVECAVVGYPHPLKGEGILVYVVGPGSILGWEGTNTQDPSYVPAAQRARERVRGDIRERIGPVATPDRVVLVAALPKTRSGKIMRRILRKLAADPATPTTELGDTSTLLDPAVIDHLRAALTAETA